MVVIVEVGAITAGITELVDTGHGGGNSYDGRLGFWLDWDYGFGR